MDENLLVQAAQAGDLEAFNQLALQYQDVIYHQAFWILGEDAPAEDAVQEALILAYRKLDTFKGGSFRAWLVRIATHVCYDELRRWKRRPSVPLFPTGSDDEEMESPEWLEDMGESPEASAERTDLRLTLERMLEKLTPEFRAVISLVDVQGFDYTEAAEALGIPTGTVKSRLARARLRLRENFRETYEFPIMEMSRLPACT
jgi:RNA polymerase sigma-70 factor (ECF subfamily)